MSAQAVRGHCPACGWESLVISAGDEVVCCRPECPRPDALPEILRDGETGHIVWLREGDFTIRHPLRERLGDELLACQLHADLAAGGPPRDPGKYRVRAGGTVARAYDWETAE